MKGEALQLRKRAMKWAEPYRHDLDRYVWLVDGYEAGFLAAKRLPEKKKATPPKTPKSRKP